jgi:hypothetical protein
VSSITHPRIAPTVPAMKAAQYQPFRNNRKNCAELYCASGLGTVN